MTTARILIVEDDPEWQRMLKDTLEHEGYEVTVASDPDQGISALRTFGLQLVLMDLNLSDEDEMNREGLKLLSSIGMFNPCARAIVITAFSQHQREAFRASFGVYDYLLKSEFETATFLATVQEAIQEAHGCEQGENERPVYPDYV
jgi:DNA-binding response OmpR family regulator